MRTALAATLAMTATLATGLPPSADAAPSPAPTPAPTDPIRVEGTVLQAEIGRPKGKVQGKLPAVVIAPGQGYHMDLPLTRGLFDAAVAAGFVAARFNWRYMAKKAGEPAEDLGAEVADMQAVLDQVKRDPRVDPARVVVAGKSLGSMVAYRVLVKNPDVRGALLLTPIFRTKESVARDYPGLAGLDRPVAFLVGDQDAGNCQLPLLYQELAGVKAPLAKAIVVAGNHSLEVAPRGDAANQPNLDAATAIATHWLGLLAKRP